MHVSGLPTAVRSFQSRIRSAGRHYLARLHRATRPEVTFIGITGSAGKTSTKALVVAILATRGKCNGSPGTGNEHYEVERTVLATARRDAFTVVELSVGVPGYLDRSLRALRPNIGVLTLIAREHYSAFGSNEAIAAEKGKLIAALPPDGTAVLNRDDPHVRSIGERHSGKIVWVGRDEDATIRLLEAHSSWPAPLTLRVQFEGTIYEVPTRLYGTHLALSVLCALGVAVAVGVPFPAAIAALRGAEPFQGRMQIESSDDGVVFVRDDWKAPQWSFEMPLAFMRDASAKRKIIVIGTISDSPKSPSQRYALAVRQAHEVADLVVLVGVDARGATKVNAGRKEGSFRSFSRIADAAQFLRSELREGDLVLLKGTNKQDHLVRLLLDRRRPVQCWVPSCGLNLFCGSCPRLYAHVPAENVPLPVASTGSVATAAPASRASEGSLVIVGLGNPHAKYQDTPHNAGHRVVDRLVETAGRSWEERPEGLVSALELDGVPMTLLKPGASINVSGPLVQRFLSRTGVAADHCIVVHDDMDLDLGVVRAKRNGGDGGHKGVRSIISALGIDEVARIRVGVRRAGDVRKAKEVVLENFSRTDQIALAPGLERAEAAISKLARQLSNRSATATILVDRPNIAHRSLPM